MPTPDDRLAVVLSHPIQYYSPWFRWLRERAGLNLRVFYLWDFGVQSRPDPGFERDVRWDIDLLGGYDSEFVPNRAADPGTHHFRGLDNPAIVERLETWNPTAILLFGYNWLTHQRVIRWAGRRGVPLLFRGDSHFLGRGRPGLVRGLALRLNFRRFAAFATVGAANADYFRTIGVPESRLFFAPHAVDQERFNPDDSASREHARRQRAELGLEGRRVVLFAGKFQPAKQPVELLQAFQSVAGPNDALVLAGDGPERESLHVAAARRSDLVVRFLPFANQSEMPSRYLLADIFALPSKGHYETWGLAVNEAMHMGKPCLVTDRVGCQRDLVEPGRTGWVASADDPGSLAATISSALRASPGELAALAAGARARIAGYTYEQTTRGLLAALASLPAVQRG
ncbi:MAG TPA: glycosyltransferase family 4 protein [Candidatus Didemnitutus sp.]|nr:glycosyltransferase family 4 protein [Candidatus Didemnitutus sp.]